MHRKLSIRDWRASENCRRDEKVLIYFLKLIWLLLRFWLLFPTSKSNIRWKAENSIKWFYIDFWLEQKDVINDTSQYKSWLGSKAVFSNLLCPRNPKTHIFVDPNKCNWKKIEFTLGLSRWTPFGKHWSTAIKIAFHASLKVFSLVICRFCRGFVISLLINVQKCHT